MNKAIPIRVDAAALIGAMVLSDAVIVLRWRGRRSITRIVRPRASGAAQDRRRRLRYGRTQVRESIVPPAVILTRHLEHQAKKKKTSPIPQHQPNH